MLGKLPESLGHILRDQRAGMENVVLHQLLRKRQVPKFHVRSVAFEDMSALPIQFTADGMGVSPPLDWFGVPDASNCVALIVEDADSPTPAPLVHAITVSPGGDGSLRSGAMPSFDHDGTGVVVGLNSYLQHRWLPPDPPPGHGPHHYVFQLFALVGPNTFSKGVGRHEFHAAVLEHAVGAASMIGTYERRQRLKTDDHEKTGLAVAADATNAALQ